MWRFAMPFATPPTMLRMVPPSPFRGGMAQVVALGAPTRSGAG